MRRTALFALLLMTACTAEKDDSETADTGDTEDSSDTDESGDTDDTSDSGETGQPGAPLELRILHINDHHSHLESESMSVDVSGLGLTATADAAGTALTEVNVEYGGYPLLVPLFEELEGEAENVLKLHAGDAVSGTLYYSLFGGEADAAMMSHVCYDAFVLGNHEFDDGDAGLADFLDYLEAGGCGTPVLSANLSPAPESPLQDSGILPYTIVEVGGQRVGLVGLTIAQKTMASSRPDDGTMLTDETEAAQAQIEVLKAAGVDKIVLMTHYTYDADMVLAGNLSGVDVIVGGDSHTLLGGEGLSALGFNVIGPYPTEVVNADGEPVCVVQAWEYSHLLGQLDVSFDENGVVTACAGSPRVPYEAGTFSYAYTDADGVESELTLEAGDAALVSDALAAYEELVPVVANGDVSADLDVFGGEIEALEATVIGTVAEDLCLERFPGQGRSTICDVSVAYEHGSHVGDVVARAFLEVTPTADLCIQNAGGVRVDIASGDFTISDAYTVLPFSNTLVTLEVTGEQVVTVLEDALSNALDEGGSTGSYPYSAGLRYHIDASQSYGSRVSGVEVNSRFAGEWEAIDPEATYVVVTNSFVASGQDGYDAFGLVYDEGLYLDTYVEYAQGLVMYMETLTAVGESLENRSDEEASTQSYTGRDGCNHSESTDCSSY